MYSQTKNSSYRKLFSLLDNSEDVFEVQVLERILNEYNEHHHHDFLKFEELLIEHSYLICPSCLSKRIMKYGKDRNGTQRYKCSACGKAFNYANNSLFSYSKVNLKAWYSFLECILSGTSTTAACITAKISSTTSSKWMNKIFKTIQHYQDLIILNDTIYIDETYVHEDKSKIYLFEEIGKIRKVRKQPRGIS